MKEIAKKCGVDIIGITFKRVWMPFGSAFFTVLCPNTLFINKKIKSDLGIIQLVAHEIMHRNRYKKDGLFIYLLGKIYGRTIGWVIGDNPHEEEAYAEETRVDTLKRGL